MRRHLQDVLFCFQPADLPGFRICLGFNGDVGAAGISQCSTETEERQKSVLKTCFHLAKTEEEITASFTRFGTFLL